MIVPDLSYLLAEVTAQGVADSTGTLVQYGALGVGVVALGFAVRTLYARLVADADYHRQRADRLETQLRETNSILTERLVPVLGDATKVMADSLFVHQRGRAPAGSGTHASDRGDYR